MILLCHFSTIVISGSGVPEKQDDEDITDLSIELVQKLTKVRIKRDDVNNCHRMGKKVLLEFAKAGTCSQIHLVLDKSHRKAMQKAGTWINIHMTTLDSRIFFLARQMKRKGIFEHVGSTLGAVTRVVVRGQGHTIRSEADLLKFTELPLSTFEKKGAEPRMNDSGIAMETE